MDDKKGDLVTSKVQNFAYKQRAQPRCRQILGHRETKEPLGKVTKAGCFS